MPTISNEYIQGYYEGRKDERGAWLRGISKSTVSTHTQEIIDQVVKEERTIKPYDGQSQREGQ